MGGFLHLVDLKHGKMARKFGTHKRNVGGLEAPRNSLDLPVGTYKGYYSPQDDELQKYQETDKWIGSGYYPTEAPMKKLINDEMSKRPQNKANAPSIVARLMGVDSMPPDTTPVVRLSENKIENTSHNNISKEKLSRSSSVGSALSPSKSFRLVSSDSLHLSEDSDLDDWSSNKMSKKPKPREHPQEEELQKFKKEFEAWQSARFKECSKIVEHDTIAIPDQWMAQENLNKEKMVLYANSSTKVDKVEDLRKSRSLRTEEKRSVSIRRKTLSGDFEETESYSAPTTIVILKPGFDRNTNAEEPYASSSVASEDRNNIEDFLEEVKERLKFELQGKTFKSGLIRGGGIETPYRERPSDPKQIAQRIAKQVRESVTKDLGTNLIRSESTRSYRGEFQCSGSNSPEFISRDTRRLLSERLRNVLKRESNNVDKITYNDEKKDENDSQSKSFRCEPDDMNMILQRNLSPINLVRSLSAPVSGTSFGKLLLEDRHVVTGAHIRRKHEANEKLTMKVKKQRKDRFNLKERVSSLKYSITHRARLFGRRIHSASDFRDNDRSFVKDIMNGPTVMLNFGDRPENATEVPPSPASVCSSMHEDFYRAAYCASPSTPGAPISDDNDLPQAFRDISSNLNELRKQLHQLETGRSEETVIEEQPIESNIAELEDEDEAYVRDLLIASGLYDNSFGKSLYRWDSYAKPISSKVFEQVEESYRNDVNNHYAKMVDHKVLFDLLNEVLSKVLVPPLHISNLSRRMVKPPRGNTLLDQVWGMLHEHLHPPVDRSFYFFDTMVARDLQTMPWSELVNEDSDTLAKEVESHIMRDLVEETVKEMRDGYRRRF
uniref:uncharacterized protein LOC122580227 isoform X2 n=1 Tax=Erigeron canadensis TaxID=72917 RepID=UPI001CB89411|nr:uncharacterized protein LOC122580227 isoform X2 [Erigeron canadensis]